jgi:hypothetical protein
VARRFNLIYHNGFKNAVTAPGPPRLAPFVLAHPPLDQAWVIVVLSANVVIDPDMMPLNLWGVLDDEIDRDTDTLGHCLGGDQSDSLSVFGSERFPSRGTICQVHAPKNGVAS